MTKLGFSFESGETNIDTRRSSATSEYDLGIAYCSEAMDELVERLTRLRNCDLPYLITGESGVGKELIAQAVHKLSTRAREPFIAFNCSTVQRTLIASHLFGHRKGSFTGAERDHLGLFRSADGGTIFLDEVGEIPLDVQPHLLRFLENSEVIPIGETSPRKVNVRVIAATNRDLEAMVREGTFREDLYYRLNGIRLHVPSLRERREDIQVLARHFIGEFATRYSRPIEFTSEALQVLSTFEFPGNVRQLKNTIERLCILSEGVVTAREVRHEQRSESGINALRPTGGEVDPVRLPAGATLAEAMDQVEAAFIRQALVEASSVVAAARRLGLSRSTLYEKMKRLSIEPSVVRAAR